MVGFCHSTIKGPRMRLELNVRELAVELFLDSANRRNGY